LDLGLVHYKSIGSTLFNMDNIHVAKVKNVRYVLV